MRDHVVVHAVHQHKTFVHDLCVVVSFEGMEWRAPVEQVVGQQKICLLAVPDLIAMLCLKPGQATTSGHELPVSAHRSGKRVFDGVMWASLAIR